MKRQEHVHSTASSSTEGILTFKVTAGLQKRNLLRVMLG